MAEEKKAQPVAAKRVKDDVDPDNVKLSAERIEAIRAKARQIVAEERLKALEAMELEKALEDIRGKAGNVTGDPAEDEIVNITIDIGDEPFPLRINGRAFEHGKTYPVPRHQARTLQEMMFRVALHEHCITDKPLTAFFQRPRQTVVSARKGVRNAPLPAGAGTPGDA